MAQRLSLAQERQAWSDFIATGEVEPRKRNKFNARKVTVNGRTYSSGAESKRAIELQWLLSINEIFNLSYQVRYEVIPEQKGESAAYYVADFVYTDKAGSVIVEDSKGAKTKDYILKRKLMLLRYGIRICETQPAKAQRRRRTN